MAEASVLPGRAGARIDLTWSASSITSSAWSPFCIMFLTCLFSPQLLRLSLTLCQVSPAALNSGSTPLPLCSPGSLTSPRRDCEVFHLSVPALVTHHKDSSRHKHEALLDWPSDFRTLWLHSAPQSPGIGWSVLGHFCLNVVLDQSYMYGETELFPSSTPGGV